MRQSRHVRIEGTISIGAEDYLCMAMWRSQSAYCPAWHVPCSLIKHCCLSRLGCMWQITGMHPPGCRQRHLRSHGGGHALGSIRIELYFCKQYLPSRMQLCSTGSPATRLVGIKREWAPTHPERREIELASQNKNDEIHHSICEEGPMKCRPHVVPCARSCYDKQTRLGDEKTLHSGASTVCDPVYTNTRYIFEV